MAPERWFT